MKNAQTIKINGVDILAVPVKLCRFNNNKNYYWLETQDGNSICTVTTMSKNTCESVNSGRITESTKLWVECVKYNFQDVDWRSGIVYTVDNGFQLKLDSNNQVIVHIQEEPDYLQEFKDNKAAFDEVMSREKPEEEVKKDRNYAIESDYTEPLKKRFREIEEVKEETNGWISVKDRLPDTHEKVIVYYDDNCLMGVLAYTGWNIFYNDGLKPSDINIVTHWMELPPKPKTK